MRKILLSPLGTNPYLPCIYQFDSDEVMNDRPVTFIQEAIIRKYCAGWKAPDRIVIFVTKKDDGEEGSYEKNWCDANGRTGLKHTLEKLSQEAPYIFLQNIISPVAIPWGKTKDELWQVFKTVVDQFQDGDEIWFDVTHSFRSLPLIIFAALSFVRSVKKVTVKKITYGAFEVLGPAKEIEKKYPKPQDRKAPVFDLTDLLEIINWSEASMLFKKYGEAGPLLELLDKQITPVLSLSHGKDNSAHARRKLAKQIKAFIDAIRTVRGREIMEMSSFDNAINKVKQSGSAGGAMWAFDQLLDLLQNAAINFKPNSLMNGLHGAFFCIEHGLTQQAITLLDETLVSIMCHLNGLKWQDRKHREIVSSAPSIMQKPETEWHGAAKENIQATKKVIDAIINDKLYLELVKKLNIRDDINHAGMRDDAAAAQTLRNNAQIIYNDINIWIKQKNIHL